MSSGTPSIKGLIEQIPLTSSFTLKLSKISNCHIVGQARVLFFAIRVMNSLLWTIRWRKALPLRLMASETTVSLRTLFFSRTFRSRV